MPLNYAEELAQKTRGTVHWERKPKAGEIDARFVVPRAFVGQAIEWVGGIDDEHRSPARELHEELVEEEKVLAAEDFGSPELDRLGLVTDLLSRNIKGRDVVSLVVADVWTARFEPAAESGIIEASRGIHPKIRLVAEDDIERLVREGLVGGNARYFSRPAPEFLYPVEINKDNR